MSQHPFNEQKAEELVRPPLQHLSSTEESSERHPQAAPGGGKTSKAGQLKNAMVSKFSEKLGMLIFSFT